MALPILYTKEDLATFLKKKSRAIDALINEKKISYIKDGRFVKFTEAHIDEYLQSRTVKKTA